MGGGGKPVEVRRSALVAHPAARVFAVIEAAEDYPAFLPWCTGATILERDEQLVAARIAVAWRGVRFSFVTRNPKRAPEWLAVRLAEGPFRRFEGEWKLTPLAEWGCRVEFNLVCELNSAVLSVIAGPVFEHVVNTLVDAFIQRSDQVATGVAQVSTETGAVAVAAAPASPATPTAPVAEPLPRQAVVFESTAGSTSPSLSAPPPGSTAASPISLAPASSSRPPEVGIIPKSHEGPQ